MRPKRDPSELTCTLCGQFCKYPLALRDHMNIHTGNRPYSCKHCKSTFASIANCRKHQKVYQKAEGNEPTSFHCEICDKMLKTKSAFREHMKVHLADATSETGYVCQICGVVFQTLRIFQAHSKPESKTRNFKFQCRYCDIKTEKLKCIEIHEKKYHEAALSSSDSQMIATKESNASLLSEVTTNPTNPLFDEEDDQMHSIN